MSEWNISINVLCFRCKQKITQAEINQNNYQLILLPALTFQHLVCPIIKNYEKNSFYSSLPLDCPESFNLNINLK